MKKIHVAIIGCGVIGSAMVKWLKQHNKDVKISISDPAKGYDDNVYATDKIDAYFVSVNVPTLEDGTQDMKAIESIICCIPKEKDIWIRSTILPSTIQRLKEINPNVHFLPEFLTERFADIDFEKLPMIFTGNIELLKEIFPGKDYIAMSSYEASLAKYAHNVFGALKVTYFNCVRELCDKQQLDFEKVRNGILLSGNINSEHTAVPGPDGKHGYGGKCFPKDTAAFNASYLGTSIHQLTSHLAELNNNFRSAV